MRPTAIDWFCSRQMDYGLFSDSSGWKISISIWSRGHKVFQKNTAADGTCLALMLYKILDSLVHHFLLRETWLCCSCVVFHQETFTTGRIKCQQVLVLVGNILGQQAVICRTRLQPSLYIQLPYLLNSFVCGYWVIAIDNIRRSALFAKYIDC